MKILLGWLSRIEMTEERISELKLHQPKLFILNNREVKNRRKKRNQSLSMKKCQAVQNTCSWCPRRERDKKKYLKK